MMSYPRIDDYEYYCANLMAWNCYGSSKRLTTFEFSRLLRLLKMLTTFTTFDF